MNPKAKLHPVSRPFIFMAVMVVILAIANLTLGSVDIPLKAVFNILLGKSVERASWTTILLEARFPQMITALLAGSSLAISGLLLQTLFRNPLAGPSILGISDGANLGVAAVILYFGGSLSQAINLPISGYLAVIFAAFIGAFLILGLILYLATKVKNNIMLLIIGIMLGYLTSSVISILNFYAAADHVQAFVYWGMGSFANVPLSQLPLFSITSILALSLSLLLMKPLNALLLGENYAQNLGVDIRKTRLLILFSTGILTAVTTAFCGPISFIGLAVPHISRLLLGSSNHKTLLPFTLLTGSVVALLCNLMTTMLTPNHLLPLNAVTPLIGAPVVIYVILNQRKINYFKQL